MTPDIARIAAVWQKHSLTAGPGKLNLMYREEFETALREELAGMVRRPSETAIRQRFGGFSEPRHGPGGCLVEDEFVAAVLSLLGERAVDEKERGNDCPSGDKDQPPAAQQPDDLAELAKHLGELARDIQVGTFDGRIDIELLSAMVNIDAHRCEGKNDGNS